MRPSFDGEGEMEGCARPLIASGADSSTVGIDDRAGNSQTHARPLRLRRMERIEIRSAFSSGNPTPVSPFRRSVGVPFL
jgi:hypothetical protein